MKAFSAFLIAAIFFSPNFVFATCTKGKVAITPSSRFTLNGAEAFDKKTHLIWERCSVGMTWKKGKCIGTTKSMSLIDAKDYAQKLGDGWRVPTLEELFSIVEQTCSEPAINTKVFPDVKDLGEGAAPYWSTTGIEDIPTLIYYIDFMDGSMDGHTEGFSLAVRLVRSGK